MEHVAYMNKSWGMLPRIIHGTKTIESRWFKLKRIPFDKVSIGDTVYFKNSGEPVTVKSKVTKIIQYENLNHDLIKKILKMYGRKIGIDSVNIERYFELFYDKKYCVLIFIDSVEIVTPFQVSKKGYGNMASWIAVDDINCIKLAY